MMVFGTSPSTVRLARIGEKLSVFGRGTREVHLAQFDTVANSWAQLARINWLADGEGWSDQEYNQTFDIVSFSERLFVFCRGRKHLHLACLDV